MGLLARGSAVISARCGNAPHTTEEPRYRFMLTPTRPSLEKIPEIGHNIGSAGCLAGTLAGGKMANETQEAGSDSLKKILLIAAGVALGALLFVVLMSTRRERRRRKKTFWWLEGKLGIAPHHRGRVKWRKA